MSVKIWLAGMVENTHENKMLSSVIKELKKELDDLQETYHVVISFSVPGFSSRYQSNIDLAVIKPAGMIIIELKNYTGRISYGDHGKWICYLHKGTAEISGGRKNRTPFHQVKEYRLQCLEQLRKQQLNFIATEIPERDFLIQNWVSTIVLFPDAPEGTPPDIKQFQNHCSNWFQVARISEIAEAVVQQASGRNNYLSDTEVTLLIKNVLQAKPAHLIGNTPTLCNDAGNKSLAKIVAVQKTLDAMPEIYTELLHLHLSKLSTESKVMALRDLFLHATNSAIRKKAPNVTFTSLTAKVRYLSRENEALYPHIDRFRYRSNSFAKGDYSFTTNEYRESFRAVCEFTSMLLELPIPLLLLNILRTIPYGDTRKRLTFESNSKFLRVVVKKYDKKYIIVEDIELGSNADEIKINLENQGEAFRNISDILYPNAVLGLTTPRKAGDTWIASQIVLEPDRLMAPSLLGRMGEFSNSGLRYILSFFESKVDAQIHFLRGNLANQFLYDTVSDPDSSYKDSCQKFFPENTLSLSVEKIDKDWRKNNCAIQENIHKTLIEEIPSSYEIKPTEWLVEVPFISPELGLSGQMDLLYLDANKHSATVFELKSGKWDTTFNGCRERKSHKIQCLFYGDILFYMKNIRRENTTPLLYYAPNIEDKKSHIVTKGKLFEITSTQKEISKYIMIRNSVIDAENKVIEGKLRELIETLSPEDFRPKNINDSFWEKYQRPEIHHILTLIQKAEDFRPKNINDSFWKNCQRPEIHYILTLIQKAEDLSKDYFYRYLKFLMTEHVIAQRGGQSIRSSGGYARAWKSSLQDRQLSGFLLWKLKIKKIDEDENGLSKKIEFSFVANQNNSSAIREGDYVYLYEIKDSYSNISNSLLYAGYIEALSSNQLTLVLSYPQQSKFFQKEPTLYAIEPKFFSSKSGFKGVFSLLEGNKHRRDLILDRIKPTSDKSAELILQNKDLEINELLLRIRQAEDYFLLFGPPGTGKTSFAMKLIIDEYLCDPQSNMLLLAYTNRAVDEICKMLETRHPKDSYIRIGSQEKCDPNYHNRLIKNQNYANTIEVQEELKKTRIIVGTISSINAEHPIFELKTFNLAILDESSQVIEPQILSLFCGKNRAGNLLIEKFVFIGDDKQLPAVVQQTEKESSVSNPSLNEIQLHNCRESIFERFRKLNKSDKSVVGFLKKQWRMHPTIAEFCNKNFYGGMLITGDSEHQKRFLPYSNLNTDELPEFEKIISTHRLALFPVLKTEKYIDESDKINTNEAMLVAKIIHVLIHVCRCMPEEIGVVIPFRGQIASIRKALAEVDPGNVSNEWFKGVIIDTVERYQGSERNVILFSTVISKEYQKEFLDEFKTNASKHKINRKLNVAITRAREQFFVIGNPYILQQIPIYDELMEWIRENGIEWIE